MTSSPSEEKNEEPIHDLSDQPGRSRMALARALPMLLFTLCAVGLISIFAIRNYLNLSDSAALYDATAVVCSGQNVPDAAAYTGPGPHPAVAFVERQDQFLQAANNYIPPEWRAETTAEVALVLCIENDREAYRPLCDDANVINIYGREIVATLREAKTGRIVTEAVIPTDPAVSGECATGLPTTPTTNLERVPDETIHQWLDDYVNQTPTN